MDTALIILIAVVSFSVAVLAVVLLPFLAAVLHIPYAIDTTALTVLIGALGGIAGAAITSLKAKIDQNTKK